MCYEKREKGFGMAYFSVKYGHHIAQITELKSLELLFSSFRELNSFSSYKFAEEYCAPLILCNVVVVVFETKVIDTNLFFLFPIHV